jgi:hypothetical protein
MSSFLVTLIELRYWIASGGADSSSTSGFA